MAHVQTLRSNGGSKKHDTLGSFLLMADGGRIGILFVSRSPGPKCSTEQEQRPSSSRANAS